ncbi:MAG: hypothetical protein LUC88_00230 [Prevotella sp.]|nr:hypothetical protein [Prevotella sp.]
MTTSTLIQFATTADENFGNGINSGFEVFSEHIYQIEVCCEDGEVQDFEIMADSMTAAVAHVENLAMSEMIDISYINVISVS